MFAINTTDSKHNIIPQHNEKRIEIFQFTAAVKGETQRDSPHEQTSKHTPLFPRNNK